MFSHFSDEQLARLARCASVVSLPAEARVIQEGANSRDVFLLCGGTIRIQRQTPYGLFTLASLGPGSLFGETSYIDRGPRTGDAVVATAAAELVAFDSAALDAAVQEDERFHLALSWLFWKSNSGKLRLTSEKLNKIFEEPGGPAACQPIAPLQPGSDLSVDLATKRKLFAEMKLSGPEATFLAALSREKAFAPRQVIFREGERADEMYVVLEGRVMISKHIPGAGEEALSFIDRGGYFGEMGLIDDAPRTADAKAHDGGAVVLAIPREVLQEILDVHEVSSLRLLNALCHLEACRLRLFNERLVTWFILAGGSGISWAVDQPEVQKKALGQPLPG